MRKFGRIWKRIEGLNKLFKGNLALELKSGEVPKMRGILLVDE